jgi:hypothetical protein
MLAVMNVLLALLLIVASTQLFLTLQERADRAERAQVAAALVSDYEPLLLGAIEDYRQGAYEDPDVTTIDQQQLLAAEAILQTVRIVGLQNNEILRLLAIGADFAANEPPQGAPSNQG